MSENNQTEEKLTLEQVVDKIKGLISRSALAKLDIGLLLTEYKETIDHGDVTAFYENIGINKRTAQYYKKIASNETVQRLRSEGELDGLNMQEILVLIGARVNVRGVNNDNAPQAEQVYVAKGFGSFDSDRCRSTKIFNLEYKDLSNRVSELEKELAELRPATKRA